MLEACTTYKSTLLTDPNSMLAAMFSEKFPSAKDSQGRYFIDRDGECFKYILNYLRDPSTELPKGYLGRRIHQEAIYFGIQGLANNHNPKNQFKYCRLERKSANKPLTKNLHVYNQEALKKIQECINEHEQQDYKLKQLLIKNDIDAYIFASDFLFELEQ
jgi:hypothetical protein